jgi:hypothetical protein
VRLDLRKRYADLRRKYLAAQLQGQWELTAEHRKEISVFLQQYTRSQEGKSTRGKNANVARVGVKRATANKVKELARKLRPRGQASVPRFLMASKYKSSPILDKLLPERRKRWKPPLRRNLAGLSEIVLREFSFLDQPRATLRSFKEIGKLEEDRIDALLHFDDPACLDVAPYLVLAEIWPQMARIYRGGRMEAAIQRVVDAVELRRAMGMRLRESDDRKGIWAFPLRRRRSTGSSADPDKNLAPQRSEMVSDEFCDAFDRWVSEAGSLGLSDFGRSYIQQIIGELLNNAERHSDICGSDGSWSVAAFMLRRTENGVPVHRVNIAFLSVGATVAESLQTASAETRRDVADYIGFHSKMGVSDETLATVVALQDGVTRDASASAAGRGGVGFQDVMALLNMLGETDDPAKAPRMTIVSGHSCVVIQTPYLQGAARSDGGQRVIWFNEANDPKNRPDVQHVFDLEDSLAGTVVTMSFVVDSEYLKAAINAEN